MLKLDITLGFLILALLRIILIPGVQSEGQTDELIIELSNGLLQGRDNNGLYYSWESIPYAEPPVGKLRFEAPQPYRRKWTDVFDATRKPAKCLQWDQFVKGENKLNGIEDCLTVNVYRPQVKVGEKFPVLVFIHGGCFMFGGGNAFEPDLLMASGKVILVKMSYRLGPLGFLSTEDEAITGNFGLKDQQLALKWTKENIAAFGGDPEKIMLIGFSAGGASSHLHLLQPSLKDIAKSAVSISGVALNTWAILKNARENAFKLAKLVNCSDPENTQELKRCLQQQKAEDIVTAVKDFFNVGYNPFTVFGPVVEHKDAPQAFMTQHPLDILKSGNFSHIPWLASITSEDGGLNAAELLEINPQTGKEIIYDLNEGWLEWATQNLFLGNIKDNPQDYARELRRKYLGDFPFSVENYKKVEALYTDILFKDGFLKSLKLHRQYSQAPVYGYLYDNPLDHAIVQVGPQAKGLQYGTYHLDDITLILNLDFHSPPRPHDVVLSQKLIKMLTDFVETGKLAFDDCDFENNAGRVSDSNVNLMLISKDNCETITMKE